MTANANVQSLHDTVTARIVAELEQGRFPWVQPWASSGVTPLGLPQNASTGRTYSGINILLLWSAAIEQGRPSQRWLTFKQALAMGGAVRKGEKGTMVVYADTFVPKAEQEKAKAAGGAEGADKAKAKAAGSGGAEGADKGKDKGEQKTLVETVAQISLKDLSPEVQGLLEGERKHREKLERELADQKKASAEAKRLQEEALKSEQKRIAIENLTGALCEAKPGLPKTAAKLLARTMIEDGQVKIDGGRARYVITDPDAEFEEDRIKEISISDGAKRWAGTAESDELVPAPVSGPGVLRDNMGGRSRNSQVKIEDMSPVEQMSDALASVFGSRK